MKITTSALLTSLILFLGLVASARADVWSDVDSANRLGDYAFIFRAMGPLAEKGDARAQNELGQLYVSGHGVTKDYAEALKWFRKAEKKGLASAQDNLASMYFFGRGVPQDKAEAVQWWRKAATQGDAPAQYNLGRAYDLGEGVPQDYAEAYKWFDLAAANQANNSESRTYSAKRRDEVAAKMTPAQVAAVQKPPVPAAAAPPATAIDASLDSGSRSIRLAPLGVSVAIPDDMAISRFNASKDAFSLSGDFKPSGLMSIDVRFVSGGPAPDCAAWFAASDSMKSRLKTQKKGAEFYDSRWHPKYYENKSRWVTLCMDRPGGFVFVETVPIGATAVQPMRHFTANVADALLPQTVQTSVAAQAPAPTPISYINISNELPVFFGRAVIACEVEQRQAQCAARDQFQQWRALCQNRNDYNTGDASACRAIGKVTRIYEEFGIAAKYFQRACDLGEAAACKEAKDSERKGR